MGWEIRSNSRFLFLNSRKWIAADRGVAGTDGRETSDEISASACGIKQQIRRLEREKALAAVPQEQKVFLNETVVRST
jgi:hypothetical protein